MPPALRYPSTLRQHAADRALCAINHWDDASLGLIASAFHKWIGGRDHKLHSFVVAPEKGLVWWVESGPDTDVHHERLCAEDVEHSIVDVRKVWQEEIAGDAEVYANSARYRLWFTAHHEPAHESKASRR